MYQTPDTVEDLCASEGLQWITPELAEWLYDEHHFAQGRSSNLLRSQRSRVRESRVAELVEEFYGAPLYIPKAHIIHLARHADRIEIVDGHHTLLAIKSAGQKLLCNVVIHNVTAYQTINKLWAIQRRNASRDPVLASLIEMGRDPDTELNDVYPIIFPSGKRKATYYALKFIQRWLGYVPGLVVGRGSIKELRAGLDDAIKGLYKLASQWPDGMSADSMQIARTVAYRLNTNGAAIGALLLIASTEEGMNWLSGVLYGEDNCTGYADKLRTRLWRRNDSAVKRRYELREEILHCWSKRYLAAGGGLSIRVQPKTIVTTGYAGFTMISRGQVR